MSIKKIIYIGFCFSVFMCLRALAMTPASDAELAGVTAANCTRCVYSGGGPCAPTLPPHQCPETTVPQDCAGAHCDNLINGPLIDDACGDTTNPLAHCQWLENPDEYCIMYRSGYCMYSLIDMVPHCECNSLFGDLYTNGHRKKCTTSFY